MRKTAAIILALVMILSLCACVGGKTRDASEANATKEPAEAAEPVNESEDETVPEDIDSDDADDSDYDDDRFDTDIAISVTDMACAADVIFSPPDGFVEEEGFLVSESGCIIGVDVIYDTNPDELTKAYFKDILAEVFANDDVTKITVKDEDVDQSPAFMGKVLYSEDGYDFQATYLFILHEDHVTCVFVDSYADDPFIKDVDFFLGSEVHYG